MGTASRVAQLCLRIWQLICSVIVLGILSSFLHRVSQAGATRDGRIVYGIITSSISTAFSIVFIAPFLYSFLAWPADFVLFIMWLVLFCLEMTRTGVHTCSGGWFSNYWSFYWGRFWRRPVLVTTSSSGCSQWRTVLAFSFLAMFAFFITTFLGAYVVYNYWTGKKTERRTGAGTAAIPPTSQIGGPSQMANPSQTGGVVDTEPGLGAAPAQPGQYV
ncbi:hypothetical protein C8A05DRAFT_34769 [Staphylotrichum tortipilum]|uniref:MARVEL domain-containing protein n=1 Tax=Staphylotrichum tortipilum TaxID=2831512 RepID=A0AAN6MJ57_9PEZI|nr:hypothetical protein C8A05DRAFT_34769 [Staphylotrichum longicolle]